MRLQALVNRLRRRPQRRHATISTALAAVILFAGQSPAQAYPEAWWGFTYEGGVCAYLNLLGGDDYYSAQPYTAATAQGLTSNCSQQYVTFYAGEVQTRARLFKYDDWLGWIVCSDSNWVLSQPNTWSKAEYGWGWPTPPCMAGYYILQGASYVYECCWTPRGGWRNTSEFYVS